MATKVNKISRGNVIEYEKQPCLVIECKIVAPPNMSALCQMTLKNLKTGKVIHNRTNVGDSYEVLHKEIKDLEYSYPNGDMYAFMDLETYETIELPDEVVGDAKDFLIEGKSYQVFFVDGSALGVELPASIEMKVIEAPEVVRGDTSGNVQKTVVLETGIEVKTPPFIKEGEIIKIRPEDRSYQGRA
ncbi:elongation factor P [Pelagicoccus sp. SDUM812003]|uniref:elongation factor P n=1 Tax=Pelagicoccus sp. SDUM812003 TaxID=3041267 RepID=UPI00280E581F|nr:elongation factor P [Pelagicoccus sp. SDUM812003]MDQ8203534.1 elongation factor P [Pelagicoccus sp. SDUM812003]